MMMLLHPDPTKRPSGELLYMWTLQFFEAVAIVSNRMGLNDFDEAIEELCRQFYKPADLKRELRQCLAMEERERDLNMLKVVQERMAFANNGFRPRNQEVDASS